MSKTEAFRNELRKIADFANLNATVRVAVTEKCNFHCAYCHKEGMQNAYEHHLNQKDYAFLAKTFYELGFRKVKFTGGEPLLRKDIAEIVSAFKTANYADVSLVTNGSLITEEILKKLKNAGLDRITISLDTLSKKTGKTLNACDIESVLNNIPLAKKYFDDVKINCVLIEGINFPEEIQDMANFCRDNAITLKLLSRLQEDDPYALSSQAINTLKQLKQLAKKETKNDGIIPSSKYTFTDGTTVETSEFRNEEYRKKMTQFPYCHNCPNKANCTEGPYSIRIMPNGDIKPCLIRNDNTIPYPPLEKKAICISGLASTGKSSFRKLAEKEFKITGVYVGETLKKIVQSKGKEPTYKNIIQESKQIFEKEGPLGVLKKSFENNQNEIEKSDAIIIDSVRRTEEYEYIKQNYKTTLIAITCSKEEREKRAKKSYFKMTKEELEERDKLENGENNQNPLFDVKKVLKQAEYTLSSEDKDHDQKAKEILKKILEN
jgi:cyclic pyranopterin phosphate synthase